MMTRPGRFPARGQARSGSGDCPVRSPDVPNKAVERSDSYGRPKGAVAIARHHLMFQTKRWNEAIRMARPKRRSRHPGIRQALALAPGSFPALAQTRAAL
jgi:hypothetical protein